MAAYLFCLTSDGGVPVFARNRNGLKPLPFPVIGSLNGVHMFARSNDVELLSTVTDDSKIVWKSFHDSLTLIVVAEDDNAADCHLQNMLLYVFDVMVMFLGIDDVKNIKNVERFKRDIRVCYPVIDRFVEDNDVTFGDLVNAVDVIAAAENTVLQVPHRLMTFQLTRNVEVCVLCGPSPSLADLEEEVGRFWRTGYDSLRSVLQNHPGNIPSTLALDSNLLGFLLVNVETNRCLCSVNPPSTDDDSLEVHEKRHILRSYYKHVIGNYFSSKVEGSEKGPSDFTHSAMDTYMTTDTHKCYAMLSPPHQIYALYNISIPTFAMRSVTEKTLHTLTRDKSSQV